MFFDGCAMTNAQWRFPGCCIGLRKHKAMVKLRSHRSKLTGSTNSQSVQIFGRDRNPCPKIVPGATTQFTPPVRHRETTKLCLRQGIPQPDPEKEPSWLKNACGRTPRQVKAYAELGQRQVGGQLLPCSRGTSTHGIKPATRTSSEYDTLEGHVHYIAWRRSISASPNGELL